MADDDRDNEDELDPPEPPPVSARVLDLYRQACQAKSQKGRARAMLALAIAFTEEHDFTDFTATDDWHAYIEDFEHVRLQYERSALRLARLICNTLEEFYDGDEPHPVADLGFGERIPSKLN
jgi:hypothetical protein